MQTSDDSQRNEQKSKALRQQQKTEEKLSQLAVTDDARDPRETSAASNYDENVHASYKSESLNLNSTNDEFADVKPPPKKGKVMSLPQKPSSSAASSAATTNTPVATVVDPNIKLASSPEETFKAHYIEVQSRPTECVSRKHVKEGGNNKIVRRDICTNSKCTNVKCILLHFKDGQKVQDLKLNLLQVMNELRLLHTRSMPSNKKDEVGSDRSSSDSPISQISEQEMKNILRGLKKPIKMDKNKSVEQNLLQIADEKLRSTVAHLLPEPLFRAIEKRFGDSIGFVSKFSNKDKNNDDDDEEKPQHHALYHANIISGDDRTLSVFFIRPEYNTSKFEIVGIGQHADKSQSEDSKTYYDMSFYFFPECGFLEENPRAIVNVASGLGLTKK